MTHLAALAPLAALALITAVGIALHRRAMARDKAESAVPGSTEERLAWEMARRWWE
jgi:hypothetical protein